MGTIDLKNGLGKIEDRLTGDSGRLREMYQSAFNEAEAERLAHETKGKNRKTALLILLMLIVMLALVVSNEYSKETFSLDLTRPAAGGAAKTIEAEISAEYDGYTAKERTRLRILPKEPSPDEAEKMLFSLAQRLPDAILGQNTSLTAVSNDLTLPSIDTETGAELSWRSSDARIISNEGEINLVGVEPGTVVALTVYIRLASRMETLHIAVITAEMPEEKIDAALKARMEETIKEISLSRDGEAAVLPVETNDGVKLSWAMPEQEDGIMIIFACVILMFFCYTQRYRAASRYIEKARAEIERDFPDFIQKLGLLLDAGLVITSAIERITGDYLKTSGICGKRRLYEELASALDRTRAAGTSLVTEFSELARRSGLRELMRFSSTLSDNIDKGSTLSGKLRAENELLWESRKKRVEKEGRVAETKLIFPMALQILAIIAITVTPAVFEMN